MVLSVIILIKVPLRKLYIFHAYTTNTFTTKQPSDCMSIRNFPPVFHPSLPLIFPTLNPYPLPTRFPYMVKNFRSLREHGGQQVLCIPLQLVSTTSSRLVEKNRQRLVNF